MPIYTVEDYAKNPGMLSGNTLRGNYPGLTLKSATLKGTAFKNANLDGLKFEDMRFENCLFDEVDIKKAKFTRCNFERCKFVNTHIKNSVFTVVIFKDGIFTYRGLPISQNYNGTTHIRESRFNDVLFDKFNFDNHDMSAITGTATFININVTPSIDFGEIISGNDLYVRANNCFVKNTKFCMLWENSSLYATNCRLLNSGFDGHNSAKLFYIENCEIIGGIGAPELLIVKNCKIRGDFGGGKASYIVNTEFIPRESGVSSGSDGDENSHLYILGGGHS